MATVRSARRKTVRESAREAFRAGILEAAERVFIDSGFQSTKMAHIAKAAGVAVGTLYNYFESKEVIFNELVMAREEGFLLALEPTLRIKRPLERLEQMVAKVFAYMDENAALFAIFVERGGVAECDIERLGGRRADEAYVRFLDMISETITAAVRSKKLRSDLPVETMAAALSGAMNGVVYSWMKNGRRDRLADSSQHVVTLFLSGAKIQ